MFADLSSANLKIADFFGCSINGFPNLLDQKCMATLLHSYSTTGIFNK